MVRMSDSAHPKVEDVLSKQHHFKLSQVSGTLIYSIDQGPSVSFTFKQDIQLTVLVAPRNGSTAVEENSSPKEDTCDGDQSLFTTVLQEQASDTSLYPPSSSVHSSGSPFSVPEKPSRPARKSARALARADAKKRKPGTGEKTSGKKRCQRQTRVRLNAPIKLEKDRVEETAADVAQTQDGHIPAEEPSVEQADSDIKKPCDKAVTCQYCLQEFPTARQFYDHRRTLGKGHVCGICGKVEQFEAYLIVHMQRHRRVELEGEDLAPLNTSENNAKDLGKKISKKEKMTCNVSPQNTSEKNGKDLGKKSKKEKMKCNVCGLVVSSMDSLKIHTMLHTGESPYRCCVCESTFPSLSSREHHMDTHVTAHRFRCAPCNLRFPSRAELAKHQLSHQFKCDLCGQVFPNKTSRACHFRVAHPLDILRCSQCPALFSSAEALARHTQYHARGQKQQCPVCGRTVSKLKEHMLMHSAEPPARMHVCDQCPKSYLRRANLERHMRTHSGEKPYACPHCSRSFGSNGMLRKHLLTHTQERPYQCEVCGKRCALRSNLAVHMRVHSTHRKFSCPICPQTFNHKNSLEGHIKSKHSKPATPPPLLPTVAPLSFPLPPPVAATGSSTLVPSQVCEVPQPLSRAEPVRMSQMSSIPSMSSLAVVPTPSASEGRTDFSHLVPMGYHQPGGEDTLLGLQQGQMLHHQSGLSFSYPNT